MKARRCVAGLHAAEAALPYGPERIITAWMDPARTDARLTRLLDQLRSLGIKPQPVNRSRLDSLAEGDHHQGLVLEVRVPEELGEVGTAHRAGGAGPESPCSCCWIMCRILTTSAPVSGPRMRRGCREWS